MTGHNIARLATSVAGMSVADVTTSIDAWESGRTALQEVSTALGSAADRVVEGFGAGTETGPRARKILLAMQNDVVGPRLLDMRDASEALDKVSREMVASQNDSTDMPTSEPGPAPKYTGGTGDTGDDVAALKTYLSKSQSHQRQAAAYGDADEKARVRVENLNRTYDEAADVMARIHGEPIDDTGGGDGPATPGAGGGPGSGPAVPVRGPGHGPGPVTPTPVTPTPITPTPVTPQGPITDPTPDPVVTPDPSHTTPPTAPTSPGTTTPGVPPGSIPGSDAGPLPTTTPGSGPGGPSTAAALGMAGAGLLGVAGVKAVLGGAGGAGSTRGASTGGTLGASARRAVGGVLGRGGGAAGAGGQPGRGGAGAGGTGTRGAGGRGAGGRGANGRGTGGRGAGAGGTGSRGGRSKDGKETSRDREYDVDEDWTDDEGTTGVLT